MRKKLVQPRYFVRRVNEYGYLCLVVDRKGEAPDLKVVTVKDADVIAKKLNRIAGREKRKEK